MSVIAAAEWWSSRRLQYNGGLLIAGCLAFIAYAIIGWTLLGDSDFEVTVFTTLFQGLAFLFMVMIANVFYSFGTVSERILCPKHPDRYREVCYRIGYWFSISLPFAVPILLLISALLFKDAPRQ